ncbi:hypothetical protein C6Y14_38370 [Streptomyces dioscori]|uniref:CHAT domain-containing protein n=1 Tax=Streptomyces dioscori TaxID=2109333 RepID=A0A2P8PW47_9ACTN|nr:CHAT domain-containing protein [Streptomyces dioscori]PSM38207.1 hypothetical protein C6Y14_38370 [Streptomyces dioscori]
MNGNTPGIDPYKGEPTRYIPPPSVLGGPYAPLPAARRGAGRDGADPGGRRARTELATRLLLEAAAAFDDGPGADVGRLVALLDEADRLVAELMAGSPAPLSGEHRRLCRIAAEAMSLRDDLTGREPDFTRMETLLSAAAESSGPSPSDARRGDTGVTGASDEDDTWWDRADSVEAACALAQHLAARWDGGGADGGSPADADRIIALLAPTLDGPDHTLVADVSYFHAVLGFVLADRAAGPDRTDPERLADRAAARRHLREAHDAAESLPELAAQVAFSLAEVGFLELGNRSAASPGPFRSAADGTGEYVVLLDLLRPLSAERGRAGGRAVALGATIAEALLDTAPAPAERRLAASWFEESLTHPAVPDEDAADIRFAYGLLLVDRAESNTARQDVGDPPPHADRAKALALFERILPLHRSMGGEGHTATLAAVVELLWLELSDSRSDDSGFDRFVTAARELARLIDPDDTDRAELLLKSSIGLAQRALNSATPRAWGPAADALMLGDRTLAVPVERSAPRAAQDLREAAGLLRMATGLYHHEDDLYFGSLLLQGTVEVLDFAIRQPEIRLDILQEGIRLLRIALERLPARHELRDPDVTGLFLMALTWHVWYSAPFAASAREATSPGLPDIAGYAGVEDDVQLVGRLLDAEDLEREPLFTLLAALLAVITAPDGRHLAPDICRAWHEPLRRAARELGPEAWTMKSIMLGMSGVLGLQLAARDDVPPAERRAASAAATVSLREARDLVPTGSPFRRMLDAAARGEAASHAQAVVHFLLGSGSALGAQPGMPLPGAPGTVPRPPSGPGPGRDLRTERSTATRRPDSRTEPGTSAPDVTSRPGRDAPGTTSSRSSENSPARTTYAPVAPDPATGRPVRPGTPDARTTQRTSSSPRPSADVGGEPAGGSPEAAERTDPSERLELDPDVVVALGDGSPDPFALPVSRVMELVHGADGPRSAEAAATLAMAHHRRWLRERHHTDLTVAAALLMEATDRLGTQEPGLTALGDRCAEFMGGLLLDRYLLLGDHADLDSAAHTYERLLDRVPEDLVHPPLDVALTTALARSRPDLPRLFRPADQPPAPFRAEVTAAAGTAWLLLARFRAGRQGDQGFSTALAMLGEAARHLPDGHPRLPVTRSELSRWELAEARRSGDRAAARAALDRIVAAADAGQGSPHRSVLALRAAAALQAAEGDGEAATGTPSTENLDRAITLLEETAEEGGHDFHGSRARCRYGLGVLLLDRFHRTGRRGDLDAAVTVLQDVRGTVAPTPGDPFVIFVTRALALAYRAHGPGDGVRRRQSREAAKSVLGAHGRAVLLQTGTDRGLAAARSVAADMRRSVRWCLADRLPEAAVEAVELGRGLVLHGATVGVTVPEMLRAAGRPELAAQWSAVAPAVSDAGMASVPDDLRRRALQALTAGASEPELLSAPSPSRIGRALRNTGADALVHLVPGEDGPGHALVVTATGAVRVLPLPRLRDIGSGPLAAYLGALRAFQEESRPENRPHPSDLPVMHSRHRRRLARKEREWRESLDALASWAGETVMNELVAAARAWWPGRLPRLVLAPAGALGVVPWHAARCPKTPGSPAIGFSHALEHVAVSYCASARQLIDVATRPRLTPGQGPVVLVVDPLGSASMRGETLLIQRLHQGSTVIGDPYNASAGGSGAPLGATQPLPATSGALDPFLPGRGATSAALLHINCHADTGPTAARSVLRLAQGQALTVADLLEGARRRDPRAPGGTVILANCTSDLTLSDHDEALTLSTALLSAGATTVVGSRWAIPDDPRTTLMMGMLHYHLRGGAFPADALRATQLWMLDSGRTLPEELSVPGPALERPLEDLDIWASFTHQGQ